MARVTFCLLMLMLVGKSLRGSHEHTAWSVSSLWLEAAVRSGGENGEMPISI